ncbi:diaminohydroxyphosphoribosylaminopyrimidine deaminase [Thermosyntropha lipolytica DSM 11003]|uniref:Riboflavin biosynthesis protein RibD n=1 Tax=Thermosyntropha lipolytica DSM 11003 TaxID=1123382 RepID=A0A1M5R028_9FIRM|nr:bifunctional diaminohydroxyphosphoribosylaminopyrimidine deaminase/5-amino-6-(5-phosphoribosylamino)uracil reductase RibD [Thermosyntropha lipolytica]SHH19329.1 diaminohydroxyphosphoribosylaminopyrimidine deaminase [Thermosyntropha lipolytica DSM 11003]
MTAVNDDAFYMQRALNLAAKALGRTSPNPVVGAVIVKEGQIVGEGYHKKAGTPHAEIHALKQAGEKAKGATMYVTLEPCSHYGRTPPCAYALIEAGIKKVVMATLDPNPKVAGRGKKILEEAGVETVVGVLEEEAKRINEVFFKHITTGLPFVSLKYAMTMDGKIATLAGDSRWISGEESRSYVHKLRNIYDGIMVGINTVLKDDPMLNCRLDTEEKRDPVRIIIDGTLMLPLDSNIVKTAHQQRTIVITALSAEEEKCRELEKNNIEILKVAGEPDHLDLVEAFKMLLMEDICSILVEGGARLNASLLEHRLVDKVYCFLAPKITGGTGITPVEGKGVDFMKDAYTLKIAEYRRLDEDILVVAYTGW